MARAACACMPSCHGCPAPPAISNGPAASWVRTTKRSTPRWACRATSSGGSAPTAPSEGHLSRAYPVSRGGLLIGGEWQPGAGPTLDVTDKFTGEVIGAVECAGREQVDAA